MGRSLSELFVKPPPGTAGTLLAVDGLVAGDVGPVSFTVAAGEIVGLVGLRGAGHDTVGRVLFGDLVRTTGTVTLGGTPLDAEQPREAIARRVGFVSSKRAEESLAPTMTVRENLFMNPLMTGTGLWQPIRPATEQARCRAVLKRFAVRPPPRALFPRA